MNQQSFLSQYKFNPDCIRCVGVESEYFLMNGTGMPVGKSPSFLKLMNDEAWTYELSACQVEHRTPPVRETSQLLECVREGRLRGIVIAGRIGTKLKLWELAPEDMVMDIYPHDERYAGIAASLTPDILAAACRVAGTHIHIGVANIEDAIRLHNALVPHVERFIALGDHTNGERMGLYKVMANCWMPSVYESVEHLHAVARDEGFESKLRNCWHVIRISCHGTVELRMFGITEDLDEIGLWVEEIRKVEQHCTFS